MRGLFERFGPVLPVAPNWARPAKGAIAYKTSITTSRDGTEDRSALRKRPRYEVQMRADMLDQAAQDLLSLPSYRQGDDLYTLPIPWRRIRLAVAPVAGDTALQFESATPAWVQPGSELVFLSDGVAEVVTVGTTAASSVTLTGPTQADWSAPGKLYLGLKGRLKGNLSLSAGTDRYRTLRLAFEGDGAENLAPAVSEPAMSYAGYPILTERPDRSRAISVRLTPSVVRADSGRGVVSEKVMRADPDTRLSSVFLNLSSDQAAVLENLFHYLKGRQGAFWLPSQFDDFDLSQSALSGATTLHCAGEHLARLDGSNMFGHVLVQWPDGCLQVNQILSIAANAGESVFTLAQPWGADVTTECELSFAVMTRLARDVLESEHLTDEVSKMSWTGVALRTQHLYTAGPVTEDYLLPENSGGAPVWGTETDDYLELDLEAHGVPLSAVDRGLARIDISQRSDIGIIEEDQETVGSEYASGSAALYVKFYDAGFVELPPVSPETATETGEFGLSSRGESALDLSLTVPEGCRHIRCAESLDIDIPASSEIHARRSSATVSTPPWGRLYQSEDYICP